MVGKSTTNPNKLLTKRRYMYGLQCPEYLWITFEKPELIPELDIVAKYRINERKLIGELVEKLFPRGIRVSIDALIVFVK